MPVEFIWAVSAEGVPCRIPAPLDPRCATETEWQEIPCSDGASICTIVASPHSSFAIDRAGRVLVLVLPTHVAIRERVEIYNNQRWIGIWRGTFFIDRPKYSDESGQISKDPTLNEIDPGWSWEDKWVPQLDPRKYDKEGWQFSLSFLAPKWDKKCRMYHLVRRRVLKRHMRYTSHDQWIEISNEESRMFTELAIGGLDVMNEGEVLLFALGSDGNIYRRAGIQSNKPGGSGWDLIPRIIFNDCESDDVTLISASSSLPTLIAITWDGKMFHRKGITQSNPTGLAWQNIPTPKNKAVICAAIGTRTIWCITADGCVWFNRLEVDEKLKEHTMKHITSETYQIVTQGGVSKLSVTRNDQVFCISTHEKIQIRTGIESNEPSGKRFEVIVDRLEPKDKKWISIHSGSVTFPRVPEYFTSSSSLQSRIEVLQFRKAEWRLQILERLQESTSRSWSAMNGVQITDLDSPEENESNRISSGKQLRCQIMKGDVFRSVNITITAKTIGISSEQSPTRSIETSSIKSVLPSFQRLPQKYLLYVFFGSQSEHECFAFTEESSRTTFQSNLESVIRDHICSSTRNSFGESMWSVSIGGVVRWHCLAEMSLESKFEKRVNPAESRGLVVDGLFESIDCGVKGSVWAINESGNLYALSNSYSPLNSHSTAQDYKMTCQRTLMMYEYQKYAVFRGFISFQGSQKGIYAWMCDGKPCPASFSSLPSRNWSWIDPAWHLEDENWKYSSEIDGVFEYNEKGNGKARRRVWTRRARFELSKSPWCHIEAPPVQCVRLAKRETLKETITVVALTKDGHILKRNGVERNNFTGTGWTEVLTDSPVSMIHLQWEGLKLWCITPDMMIMSRSLKSSETGSFLSSSDWRHLDMDFSMLSQYVSQKSLKDLELTGYSDILYLRIGFLLFRIDTKNETISDAYPMDNLQQAVVNAQGSICLRGTNITVVRDWRVVPYTDRKATIIAMRNVDRATNMGLGLKSISMY